MDRARKLVQPAQAEAHIGNLDDLQSTAVVRITIYDFYASRGFTAKKDGDPEEGLASWETGFKLPVSL